MDSNKHPSAGEPLDHSQASSPQQEISRGHSTLLTRVDLPDFGIAGLKARLDATLEGSRLAVDPWEEIDYEGVPGLRFKVFPIPEESVFVIAEAPLVRVATEERGPLIRSPLTLDGATHAVNFELCPRRPDGLCLELGRDVLWNDFDESDLEDGSDGFEQEDADEERAEASEPTGSVGDGDAAELTVIGWREYVHLPDWGFEWVRAKADTGARSSAVDVSHIEELPGDRVRFEVMVKRGKREKRRMVEADILRRARVKSSFGRARDRIFVEARLTIAGRTIETEVGLVNRENMLSRMLLGRRTLEGAFLVDSGRRFLHGQRRRGDAEGAGSTATP